MFIRLKKRNNVSYAYLVENKWYKSRQQSHQKIKKYLGRVYSPEKKQHQALSKFIKIPLKEYIKKTPFNKIFFDLICLELSNYSFKQIKQHIWKKENIVVDLKNKKVYDSNTKKTLCLELNNNFLTNLTLTKLFTFKPSKQATKLQIGKALANTLLSAGIILEQDIFLQIFNKMY